MTSRFIVALCAVALLVGGCKSHQKNKAARPIERNGTEIVACGQLFDIGTPVVLWMDPGGYDAYRTERRFAPWEEASYEATTQKSRDIDSPARFGYRFARSATPAQIEQMRAGLPLEVLQQQVDQFVIHYDVAGTSRQCFRVLHDMRGLSVQFMLDIDGTIYQTMDLKERAWHASQANDRSIGIEIANMGAYSPRESQAPLAQWYERDENGQVRITVPERLNGGGVRTPNFVGHPARNQMIEGEIRGIKLRQYDYTPEQYEALVKLTAALCTVFPEIKCDYPRGEDGELITTTLPDEQWKNYKGVLGHFHVSNNKIDPGPAFQWDRVISRARQRMGLKPAPEKKNVSEQPSSVPATTPSKLASLETPQ